MRPRKINGVTVRPRWNWSSGYAKEVARQLSDHLDPAPPRDAQPGWRRRRRIEDAEDQARQYLDWWLAEQKRPVPAPHPGEELRVRGVWTEPEHGPALPGKLRALRYESGIWSRSRDLHHPQWNCNETIAVIEIPHWSFEHNHDQPEKGSI